MDTKLTLKLDKSVIEQAKIYARKKQKRLSALVETYFRFLLEEEKKPQSSDISPTVRELSGIIQLDEDVDIQEEYTSFLLEKYR